VSPDQQIEKIKPGSEERYGFNACEHCFAIERQLRNDGNRKFGRRYGSSGRKRFFT
jgi:hypothetical protein